MATLQHHADYPVLGTFVIVKIGSSLVLGLKPVRRGAVIKFFGTEVRPTFSGEDPLVFQSTGQYKVSDVAGMGAHHFNMDGGNTFPYSIFIQSDGREESSFKMVGQNLRVVLPVKANQPFSIEFCKGLTPQEDFPEAAYLHSDNQYDQLQPDQRVGFWNCLSYASRTLTFRVSMLPVLQNVSQTEVYAGEDGDLEIEP